jgi:GNAT superfamily N-acetyltransferase
VDGLCGIARLNLVTAKAEVRPASDADLATLVAALGERHWFADRLARQRRGGGVLLVAWLDGRPVGEVFLECEPAKEPEVRRHLPGVPRLDHLEVPGPFQGRGIGTALIRAAEDTARRLGHERITLGVRGMLLALEADSRVGDAAAITYLPPASLARRGERTWDTS